MNQIETGSGLAETAEQVARGLAKASMLGGRAFIRTPVLFPSGSTVVVVLHDEGGGRYRVSDLGQGAEEAETLGLAAAYRAQAAEIAKRNGIAFDDPAFVVTRLERDQVAGAVMAVANAAARALERALLRNDGRRQDAAAERLVTRLRRAFPDADVARDVELRGVSTHAWTFDAMLRRGPIRAAFDVVTPYPASIAFATTKFHDLSRLEEAPVRVAVVNSKAALGDLLAVVSQAARVIEEDAPDSVLTHLVAQASKAQPRRPALRPRPA